MARVCACMVEHDTDAARDAEASRARSEVAKAHSPQLDVRIGRHEDLALGLDAALDAQAAHAAGLCGRLVAFGRARHRCEEHRPERAVVLVAQVQEHAVSFAQRIGLTARDLSPAEPRETRAVCAQQRRELAVREDACAVRRAQGERRGRLGEARRAVQQAPRARSSVRISRVAGDLLSV